MLPSYGNQSIDLTGFYMRETLAINGLILVKFGDDTLCMIANTKIWWNSEGGQGSGNACNGGKTMWSE